MKKSLIRFLRCLVATGLLAAGTYWFVISMQGWVENGFPVFTSGEKGKDPFSGMLFSVVMILYGAVTIYRLVKEIKTGSTTIPRC